MTDANAEVITTASNEATETTENVGSVQELTALLEQERASKARILNESKSYKAKYQEVQAQKETEERELLMKKGNTEELAKKLQEDLLAEKRKRKELQAEVTTSNIHRQVEKIAPECYTDDVVNNLRLNPDLLVGQEYDKDDLAFQIDELRKMKPRLFDNRPAAMSTSRPGYTPEKPKSLAEMTREELEAHVKANFN